MKLRVELAKIVIQRRQYRECAFWLAAREHFKAGYFLDAERIYKLFGQTLGISSRSARRWADQALKAGFLRGTDMSNRIYFNSLETIYKRFNIQTVSAFEVSTENLVHFQEFIFSAYVQHLIKSRRHRRKKGIHESSWIQSVKKGDTLQALQGRGFHSSMLSVTYLSKSLNISAKRVHELKYCSKKLGLLKFKHIKIPLDGINAKLRAGMRENSDVGRQIVFEGGKYYLNHTDLFLKALHSFKFSSDKKRAERV